MEANIYHSIIACSYGGSHFFKEGGWQHIPKWKPVIMSQKTHRNKDYTFFRDKTLSTHYRIITNSIGHDPERSKSHLTSTCSSRFSRNTGKKNLNKFILYPCMSLQKRWVIKSLPCIHRLFFPFCPFEDSPEERPFQVPLHALTHKGDPGLLNKQGPWPMVLSKKREVQSLKLSLNVPGWIL